MGNQLVPKAYGGLQPAGSVGHDEFAAHDASKAWDDAGAAEQMALSLIPEYRAYGAEQVKQAILEYGNNAHADVCVVNNELCLLIDLSNDEAGYAPFWKIKDLMQMAIAQAENAADEPTLKAIGNMLEQLNRTFRPPVPAAAVNPRPRPGIKPAGRIASRAAVQRHPSGSGAGPGQIP